MAITLDKTQDVYVKIRNLIEQGDVEEALKDIYSLEKQSDQVALVAILARELDPDYDLAHDLVLAHDLTLDPVIDSALTVALSRVLLHALEVARERSRFLTQNKNAKSHEQLFLRVITDVLETLIRTNNNFYR